MTPQDFVGCVRREVIEQNLRTYEDLLATPVDHIRDEQWRRIATNYVSMNEEQRTAVLVLTRKAMIDTASNILGILDGTSLLENYREAFALTYGAAGRQLNGDLQDYFLADLEERP